jgi:CD109 antigen
LGSLLLKSALAGFFTAVGPRTVQYGNDYKLAIMSSYGDNSTKIDILLETANGEEISKRKQILTEDKNEEITIKIDHNKVQDYKLTLTSGSFSQTVDIKTISKRCTVLIETDKAIYKPGDKVQYRVVILDSDTRPYEYNYMTINITNADGKVIFSDVPVTSGEPVLEATFDISSKASLGEYKVSVNVDDDPETTEQVFEVSKYVQPRLEVFADTKKFVAISEREVVVKLYAKYNSGEFVKGKAKVTVESYDPKTFEVLKKTVHNIGNIYNKQNLILNMTSDLNVYMITLRDIRVNFTVEFEEELTKEKFIIHKAVQIHQEARFYLEVFQQQPKINPGFPYEFTIGVRKPDGSFEDYAGTVKVRAEYYYDQKCQNEDQDQEDEAIERFDLFTLETLQNGKAKFNIDVPANTTGIEFFVSYYHNEMKFTVEELPSKTNVYLRANLKPESKLSVGENVVLQVKSFWQIKTIHYAVIGRSGELISNSSKPNAKEFEISFDVKPWMIPDVKVMVYYVHQTGEVVYDIVDVASDENLPNELTINLSSNSSQPGDTVNFMVQSKPFSTVYLHAVDHSVNLLRNGNEVDLKSVVNDLEAYDAYKKYSKLKFSGSKATDGRYNAVGNFNTFIITDAYQGKLTCRKKRSARNFGPSETPNDHYVSKQRSKFPETWFYKKVEVDENGRFTFSEKIPDSISTWDISGFAISPEFGLGIAKPQTLKASQKFFLTVHLPYSVKVGEVVKVDVSVFNAIEDLPKKTDVDVTLYSDGAENEESENEGNDFEFYSSPKSNLLRTESNQKFKKQTVTVEKDKGALTSFFIKATKPIFARIKVRAVIEGEELFDEVFKVLQIEG